MSKEISPLILLGGAAAAYFLFFKPATTTTAPVTTVSYLPGSTTPIYTTVPATTIPTTGAAVPTAYGINSGVKGGNGSFYLCSNYAQLAAANPNLNNPNYTMSAAEASQYLANYSDLQTAIPAWIGHKMINGTTPKNIQQASQCHWNEYGCAEKRIFLPLTPPSTAAYIPPPATSASGGGSFLSSALGVVTAVLPYAAALLGETPKLNDTDLQLVFTGGAVINDILPLFAANDPILVGDIQTRLTSVLKQYS